MELFITLVVISLLYGILLILIGGPSSDRNVPPTVTQTEWDEDQLLVVDRLNLVGYSKDTLIINTQRIPNGTVLVFNVAIWWPLFEKVDTRQVSVLNVQPAGRYVMIGGTIEL
jgi:hypothetical protein